MRSVAEMKYSSFLLTALIASSAVVPAHAQQEGATRARALEDATARFTAMDADKNGSLTAEEVSAVLAKRAEEMGREASPERAQRMFAGMDANKDGKVTLEEATAAAGTRFDEADTNKNGVIDPGEGRGPPRGTM
jgi:hypothetical protein